MRCIEITKFGGPEALKLVSRTVPTIGNDEVLIKIVAAGINRPDIFQRQGLYAPPENVTDIPGLEVSGKVVAKGSKVVNFQINDNVCALVPGGGYAEYVNVSSKQCLPIPNNLGLIEGAALPETYFTIWTNVFDRAKLKAGEFFLIHGGSSGIGTTAIQLANTYGGAQVIATAGSEEKCRTCIELGAKLAINYHKEDFVKIIKKFTEGKGVDVILDMVGGDYTARNIKSLSYDGRLVSIAFLRGSKCEINLMPVMLKRLTLTGSTLRPQSSESKNAIARDLKKNIWPLIEKNQIKPIIYKQFSLEEVATAHELMESNSHIGKIILIVEKAYL